MQLQHSLKWFAKPVVHTLALGAVASTVSLLAAIGPLPVALAQTAGTELTPILLMEETPKATPADASNQEPPVPMLDLEDLPPKDPPLTEAIPTKNLQEILSSGSPATNATGSGSPAPSATMPMTGAPTQPHNCNYASQLNLSHNQRFLLKHWKSRFVKDNQAAFDSIRIKRNLLKRIGKNPKGGREQEQAGELKEQIRAELKMLQAKREAQIAHVLTRTQFDQWQALRHECQPQQADPTPAPGILFNRNPEERQLDRALRSIPRQNY